MQDSLLCEETLEIIIRGNAMTRYSVEAQVPSGSPVSTILFVIYTSGLFQWVEENLSTERLPFVDDLGWAATEININQVITKLEKCVAKCTKWASHGGLKFCTAETEAALSTCK